MGFDTLRHQQLNDNIRSFQTAGSSKSPKINDDTKRRLVQLSIFRPTEEEQRDRTRAYRRKKRAARREREAEPTHQHVPPTAREAAKSSEANATPPTHEPATEPERKTLPANQPKPLQLDPETAPFRPTGNLTPSLFLNYSFCTPISQLSSRAHTAQPTSPNQVQEQPSDQGSQLPSVPVTNDVCNSIEACPPTKERGPLSANHPKPRKRIPKAATPERETLR